MFILPMIRKNLIQWSALLLVSIFVLQTESQDAEIQAFNSFEDGGIKQDVERAEPSTGRGTLAAPSSCACGRTFQKRIVNGEVAKKKAYPFLAAIYWAADHTLFCCGAILNERYVMTAAHCLEGGVTEKEIYVAVGEYDLNDPNSEDREIVNVAKVIRHPNYRKESRVDSDMAILKLAGPLVFKESVQPICLPPFGEPVTVGSKGTVAGWGTTSFGGPTSSVLLEIDVPILSDNICENNFTLKFYRRKTMLCAGHLDGSKDACQGDSGGPLFYKDANDLFTVEGIISFGKGCATKGLPGVYTKVSMFTDWILENTKDAVQCPPPVDPNSECGIANTVFQKRIANGEDVSSIRYPWTGIILLNTNGQFQLRCGCVLINKIWVLTTARCVYDYRNRKYDMTVLLGDYDYSKVEGTEEQYLIDEMHINDLFNPKRPISNDIALIKLNIPVTLSKNIRPVCLPPASWQKLPLTGIEGVITGWGDGTTSTIEQEAFVSIITNTECAKTYGNYITNDIVCAKGDNREGICNNDFGGQLSIYSSDNTYKLVGLAAFYSPKGCEKGFPSGFVRVPSFLTWINQITGMKIP